MVNDPDDANDGTPRLDATTRMPPVSPEGTGAAPDATVIGPPVGGSAVGGSPVGGSAAGDPAPVDRDATVIGPPSLDPDATRVGSADDKTVGLPGAVAPPPRWSARANVPPPGSVPRSSTPQAWEEEAIEDDPYGGRSWFTPVIVGIIALLLATALGVGVWLIYRAANKNSGPAPAQSSAPAASTAAPTSAAPTSAAPSITASAAPSPPAPADVSIPALRGDTEKSATDKLKQLGLAVVVQRRSDPTVAPGMVIDTDPPAGSTVTAGSTITLIVASAPAPSPSKSAKPTTPTASASAN
jgi:hypothetical protein